LAGRLGDEQTQADRGGKVRPAGGRWFGRGVVIGRLAVARGRDEIVLGGLVALPGLARLQGDEETGQIPARWGLRKNLGFKIRAVLRADQVQS
jgi:hypothetical protein